MELDYEYGCQECGFLLTPLFIVNGKRLCYLCARFEQERLAHQEGK